MKRYIFVSDVHGYLDKLKSALRGVNFNPEEDYLISCGDLLDRGPQAYEVIEFVMSLPNKVVIAGNHEYRWKELIRNQDESINGIDRHNGMFATFQSFYLHGENTTSNASAFMAMCELQVFNPMMSHLVKGNPDAFALLKSYLDSCVAAVAVGGDFVATHAWLPLNAEKTAIDENWFNKTEKEWADAAWLEPREQIDAEHFLEDRHLIVGHRDAAMVRDPRAVEWKEDHSIYEVEGINGCWVFCIDGAAYKRNGKVETFVMAHEMPLITIKPEEGKGE